MSSIKQQLDAAIQEGHLTAPRDYTPGARRKETEMSRETIEQQAKEGLVTTSGVKELLDTVDSDLKLIRELAEALQALLRAERDVVYDRAAIQQAKDALKKAGY